MRQFILIFSKILSFSWTASICIAQFNNFSLRCQLKVVLATATCKKSTSADLRYYHNRLPSQNILIKDRRAQGGYFSAVANFVTKLLCGVEFIYAWSECVCVFPARARTRVLVYFVTVAFCSGARLLCARAPYFWSCFNERLVQIKRVARAFVPFNCGPLMRDLAGAPPLSPFAARDENFSTVKKWCTACRHVYAWPCQQIIRTFTTVRNDFAQTGLL